jgi:predicted metalloenzyme YecM
LNWKKYWLTLVEIIIELPNGKSFRLILNLPFPGNRSYPKEKYGVLFLQKKT